MVILTAACLLAATGVCVRSIADISPIWIVLSWLGSFLCVLSLMRLKLILKPKPQAFLWVLTATLVVILLSQFTGGNQSPLFFWYFLLMGVAAWEGKGTYAFGVAFLACFCEVLALRRSSSFNDLSLFLKWLSVFITALFLFRAVRLRKEKEKLDQKFQTLQQEAKQLAVNAEALTLDASSHQSLTEEKRLTARMGSVMELEATLGRQLSLFRMGSGVQTAACFLLTSMEGKEVLRLRAHASAVTELALDLTLFQGESLVGLAAKEKRKVLLNNVPKESAKALPYYLLPQRVGSFLSMPLFLRPESTDNRGSGDGDLIGVLVLDHPSIGFFGEDKLQAVDLLCGILSDLFQNHRVVHFSRTKTENLHTLYEVSRIFAASVDFQPTLEAAVQQASKIAESDLAYIAMREGDSSRFKIAQFWAPSRGGMKPIELEEELAAWVCRSKKSIRYTIGQREKWFPALERHEGMLGSVRSFLLVPLLVEEKVIGVLRLNSQKPSAYGEYEQDVLQTLANQTALALDKANKVEMIRNLAVRDGLTGLYNHRHFQEKLTEELVKAERYKKNLALILTDVDHFKSFNDTYGHPEGDKVLVGVSRILQETVRDKADTVARYGGGGKNLLSILPETDGFAAMDLLKESARTLKTSCLNMRRKKFIELTYHSEFHVFRWTRAIKGCWFNALIRPFMAPRKMGAIKLKGMNLDWLLLINGPNT